MVIPGQEMVPSVQCAFHEYLFQNPPRDKCLLEAFEALDSGSTVSIMF